MPRSSVSVAKRVSSAISLTLRGELQALGTMERNRGHSTASTVGVPGFRTMSRQVPHTTTVTDCVYHHMLKPTPSFFGDSTRYPSSTLFVNGMPCIACARNIAGAGIARIVCLTEPDRLGSDVVRDFLVASGVTLVEVEDA